MKVLLPLLILLSVHVFCYGQEKCLKYRDSIYVGLFEMRFPIDTSKITLLTFYLDENFKSTKNFMKMKYKYHAAGYYNSGDVLFNMRLGKALNYIPNYISTTKDNIQKLDGEIIYKANSLFYHLFFKNGILITGFVTNLDGDQLKGYYDFSGLLDKSDPRWPCWEGYDDKGEVERVGFAYYCEGRLQIQNW